MARKILFRSDGRFLEGNNEILPADLSRLQALSIYNGSDTGNTAEIWENMQKERDAPTNLLYGFARGMRGPAMQMTFRGIKIDEFERAQLIDRYSKESDQLDAIFSRISEAIAGRPMNPRSTTDCPTLLYTCMRLPPQYKYDKETRQEKLTTDIEALEKLSEISPDARFVCDLITACRESRKKLQVPRSGVDADGRMRFTFNTAATTTGRFSSNKNPFGTGTNGQNITDEMRKMFIADKGKKLGNADLSQAESFAMACLANDEKYYQACVRGVHVNVAKLLWPELPWTDNDKENRKLAEDSKIWRHFTRYDLAKRGGHAKNYLTTSQTMVKKLKIAFEIAEEFGRKYYGTFTGIPAYHRAIQVRLASHRSLWSPTGRFRRFFGPRFESETLRQAVAHVPQSIVGDVLNVSLFRIWQDLDPHLVQILAQIHDAVLFQYDPAREAEALEAVKQRMAVALVIGPRTLTIPCDISVGWNWGKYVDAATAAKQGIDPNEHGLRKWSGSDERTAPAEKNLMLDLRFS